MSEEELKKQIELLVKDDEKSQETIIKQSQEIERLNNIINEIKAYIEKVKFEFESYCIDYGVIYDIIQILNKGE